MMENDDRTTINGTRDGDTPSAQTGPSRPTGVIPLRSRVPPSPDAILCEMRRYWTSLRQGRAVPTRADVDPRAIARCLDHTFILERVAPGAARIRLAGRHLIDLMGMEVRGMPICALVQPSSRGRLSDVLETVFKAPQIVQLSLTARAEYARPALSGQMLLLPLRSDLGDITRILGCLVSEGEAGVAPRRFDLTGEQISPIIEGGKILAPSPSCFGLAEDPADFALATPMRGHPGASRLAEGDVPNASATPEERRATFRVIHNDPEP
ncbi:MAG: PAS domain-containing protein [Paracoccus sp. (in: a-proteobacteria)]|nr:PAS domain-containing protein [Paracoccus sp. (in: a-proteobacteria)]